MIKILNDYLDIDTQKNLLDWFNADDGLLFSTEDVTIQGNKVNWDTKKLLNLEEPPCGLKWLLDNVIGAEWILEEFFAASGNQKVQVHADSGYIDKNPSYAVYIALEQEVQDNYTIFFDNYWKGNAATFVRSAPAFTERYNINKRITDYSDVVNYTDKPFDLTIYNRYLQHIPYENLHGLTTHSIVKNVPGTVMIWPRSMLHCGANSSSKKLFITMFLNKK